MGKVKGFKEYKRIDEKYIPVRKRIKNYKEFTIAPKESELNLQAARCMDCGVPFCHSGCPLGNLIPDFNDLVYNNNWKEALKVLHSTNNFPEFTGRLCPAPCEASCVLGIIDPPVSIELIEKQIVERGFDENWIIPKIPTKKTGKKIAIIGSGPAGLAASQQLNSVGHSVTVFERDNQIGGLLRYGIPDFKLEKKIIDRRIDILIQEGINFECNVEIGETMKIEDLEEKFDAILICSGSSIKRDLDIPGNKLSGIVQAMDFLTHNNKYVDGQIDKHSDKFNAKNKNVIVIGGGDTGSDCIGTSIRQGALSVTQLEIMPTPPDKENKLLTWPNWPLKMRTSSSQEEGADREFSVLTQKFQGSNGEIESLQCVKVNEKFEPIAGTEFQLKADLVLLAMGFVSPIVNNLTKDLNIQHDSRDNVQADEKTYKTNHEKVWVAGDMRRGQSLVVWAIREGRQCAHEVDKALMGKSLLPK